MAAKERTVLVIHTFLSNHFSFSLCITESSAQTACREKGRDSEKERERGRDSKQERERK